MYHPDVIAHRQGLLERQFASLLPAGRLARIPVATCHGLVQRLLGIYDVDKGQQTRPFSQEEQAFILNEQLLCKVDYAYAAERYISINFEGQALKPMYPLWESQRLILAEIARVEEERWRTGHPDGLLFNILKGRQLGCSTFVQSLLAHRCLTHGQVRGLTASDVPQNSGSEGLFGMFELIVEQWPWWLKPREKFHTKDRHIMWQNGSRMIVESGKSMKGGLQEDGGQKGQLGRSKTFSLFHLSEICTWERPEQINSSLMPAVPRTPRTLGARESTALGRNNYWHAEWKLAEGQKDPRFTNIFIPWYAERSKYWLPFPVDWEPAIETLEFAARAAENGPRYMHRPVALTKEQLRWYELERAAAVGRNELYKFLSEYPSEPEEAFQNSGRSIFSVATMDRLERQARPLRDLWSVRPHAELLADRAALVAELQQDQSLAVQEARAARQRLAARTLTVGDAATVTE